MKDLIKEIEKLKDFSLEDSALDIVIREITNENVDKVLDIIKQYNLITAPKSIKLSEIMSKLENCQVERYNEYINLYKPYNDLSIDFNEEIRDYYLIITNKINEIHVGLKEEFKWLYTLWLAGTEIIDDMEK